MTLRQKVQEVFDELKSEGIDYNEAIHHEEIAWAIQDYIGSCGEFDEDDLVYLQEIDEDPNNYAFCDCGSGDEVNWCSCNYKGVVVNLGAMTSTHLFMNKPNEVVHWGGK